jgi:hypothetical protein
MPFLFLLPWYCRMLAGLFDFLLDPHFEGYLQVFVGVFAAQYVANRVQARRDERERADEKTKAQEEHDERVRKVRLLVVEGLTMTLAAR